MLPDRRADLPQRLQRDRELDALVRAAHALRPAAGAGLRRGVATPVGLLRPLQPGLRPGARRRGGPRRPGRDPGLPPVPRPANAAHAASGRADRPLHPHPVGGRGLLRDAARRRGVRDRRRLLGADVIGLPHRALGRLFRDTCRAVVGREPDGVHVFPLGTDRTSCTSARGGATSTTNCACWRRRSASGRSSAGSTAPNCRRTSGAACSPTANCCGPIRNGTGGWCTRSTTIPPARTCRPTANTPRRSSRLADEIDDEFGTDDWTPLILEIADDYPAALAVLRRSDVLFDQLGARRDEPRRARGPGHLRTSSGGRPVAETGAAEVLREDALLVNPFDVTATAEALHAALLMSPTSGPSAPSACGRPRCGCRRPTGSSAQLDALGRDDPGERTSRDRSGLIPTTGLESSSRRDRPEHRDQLGRIPDLRVGTECEAVGLARADRDAPTRAGRRRVAAW